MKLWENIELQVPTAPSWKYGSTSLGVTIAWIAMNCPLFAIVLGPWDPAFLALKILRDLGKDGKDEMIHDWMQPSFIC